MIMRRIAQHLKQQHWTGVFIELAIVILGVFIGLQVDNWNQARQEHQQQQVVEARLLSDFKMLDDAVDQAIDYNEHLIAAINTLRHAVRRGKALAGEDADIRFALNRGHAYPSFDRYSSTYTELVSSGKLDLIKNEKLRIALAKYDEGARNGQFNLSQIRRAMDAGYAYHNQGLTYAPLGTRHYSVDRVVGYDIAAIEKDATWRRSLDYTLVLQFWIHANLLNQKQSVERVLKMLEHPSANEVSSPTG